VAHGDLLPDVGVRRIDPGQVAEVQTGEVHGRTDTDALDVQTLSHRLRGYSGRTVRPA